MMIRPEAMPDLPKPELGPDRIFVEPIKATPAYVPPAMQVSTMAPLISGLGSAASTLATVDWSSTFGGKDGDNSYSGTGGKYGSFVPPTKTASGNYTFSG